MAGLSGIFGGAGNWEYFHMNRAILTADEIYDEGL
jgi:hypothetical protein